MKSLLIIIFTFVLTACTTSEKFSNTLPKPVSSEALVYLVASEKEYEKYFEGQESSVEPSGYHYLQETLTNDSAELYEILKDAVFYSEAFPMCYEPRHFISYNSESGPVQLMICFECSRVLVEINGWKKWLRIDRASEPAISEILSRNGISHPLYSK